MGRKRRALDQKLSQLDLRRRIQQVGRLDELRRLARHGVRENARRVAENIDREPTQKIQVAATVDIPQSAALATLGHHRVALVGLHQDAALTLHPAISVLGPR